MSATLQMSRRPISAENVVKYRRNMATARAVQKRQREADPVFHPDPAADGGGETVLATFDDIADWAQQNGVRFTSWDHLRQVNEVRARIVYPTLLLPFERHWPKKWRIG
jgi:hypothetical protein